MLVGSKCTTCGEHVSRSHVERCPACGTPVHDRCSEFAHEFECRSSEERWIGAVEF